MPYQMLTSSTVIDYLVQKGILGLNSENKAREIGDGNLNYVFKVQGKNNLGEVRELVVKQAPPYLRCIGEEHPLAKERMHYEIKSLQKFAAACPSAIPQIYYTDDEMCLMVIQYLGNHLVLRKALMRGIIYPKFAENMAEFLARNLFSTSIFALSSLERQKLIQEFNSNDLRELSENYIFTFPFIDHPSNKIMPGLERTAQEIWRNNSFKLSVLELKEIFATKHEALIHGDLHTGSIMLDEQELYVIDSEFAFVGPLSFDLGLVMAHLIMAWVAHFERSQDRGYQNYLLESLKEFYRKFQQKFLALWQENKDGKHVAAGFFTPGNFAQYRRNFMGKIFQEAVGFAGCEIARRQLGCAGVEELRSLTGEAALRAAKLALAIAEKMIINFPQFSCVADLVAEITSTAQAHYSDSSDEGCAANSQAPATVTRLYTRPAPRAQMEPPAGKQRRFRHAK